MKIALKSFAAAAAIATAIVAASSAGAAPLADVAPADATPGAAAGEGAADIVVTARRREERAQDVPIPLTVLSGASLAAENIHTMQDITQKLPGVTILSLSPRGTTFSVRGIGATTVGNDGFESSTGVYIDGVYLGRPGMAVVDLNDIEQVEFLRGPQGTLFGKNTTVGAFNFTTRKPSFTPEVQAEFTAGNYKDFEFRGTVSGPLSGDKLAGRLTGYATSRQGFLDNVTTGGHPNGRKRLGIRGQLLALPTETLTLRLIGEYHRDRYIGGIPNTIYDQVPTATFIRNVLRMRAAGYDVRIPNTDPYARETTSTEGTQPIAQKAFTLQADWDAGNINVASITAYRDWRYTARNDVDQTSADIINCCGFVGRQKQFSQELRLATIKGERIEATAGLYYFWQRMAVSNESRYGSDPTLIGLFFGVPLPDARAAGLGFAGRSTRTYAVAHTDSYAAFAQADWHATDRLTVTVGARETYEEKSIDLTRDLGGTSPRLPDKDAVAADISGWALGLTAAATYKATDNLNLYASYGKGEKSGTLGTVPLPSTALNAADLIVKPEKIDDLEFGFKSTLFDKKLVFNANVYLSWIKDYQTNVTFFNPLSASTATRLSNARRVRSRGVEAELSGELAPGFTLSATGAYNDATFTSFANATCPPEVVGVATCDATGRRLMGAPRWTGNATANYGRDISGDVRGYVGASYAYRSGFAGTPDFSAYARIKGYGLANLWVGTHFLDRHVDLSVWVHNLFDKDYYSTMGGAYNGAIIGFTGDPRTFGATLRLSY